MAIFEKMYHAAKIDSIDQHTHRLLWRNMEIEREPDVCVITSVSFEDKPAGNIATLALRKTAEMGKETTQSSQCYSEQCICG